MNELTPTQKLLKKKIGGDPDLEKFYEQEKYKLSASVALMKLREELGLTQKELATKSGKPQSTISRIESGRMNVSVELLIEIGHAVNKELKIEFV
jgi:DNA-binding XRE family transcriptional regulator